MKKFVSIIAAAAIAASMTAAGAVTSFAEAENTASAEQTLLTSDIASEETTGTEFSVSKEEAEAQAIADAAKRGFNGTVRSSEFDAENNCWNISLQRSEGTKVIFYRVDASSVTFIDPEAEEAYSVSKEEAEAQAIADAAKRGFDGIVRSSEYDTENSCWNISLQRIEGTKIVFYRVDANTLTFIDPEAEEAAETTTTTTATSSAATSPTTSAAATTTTAAASTTQTAASPKSSSPKTGVAFPAVCAAVLVLSAASVAFTLKKKED